LVRGSAERLAPVAAAVDGGTLLPGWRLRVLDGHHLPDSEKRLAPLGGHRGLALPGQTQVVYDPDSGLVTDIVANEDAHQSERALIAPLLASAQPGQLWIAAKSRSRANPADFADLRGTAIFARARSCRAGTRRGPASSCASGRSRWQERRRHGGVSNFALDTPTEAGETAIRLWSNLPTEVGAERIAELYRPRWRVERSRSPDIEGMFQRLESVLNSEIRSLSHPRAALLGFAVAVLAYNVLSLLQRCVEQAHKAQESSPEVSIYHLPCMSGAATRACSSRCRPSSGAPTMATRPPSERLLQLARNIDPRQVATSKRGPKVAAPKEYVDGAVAPAHVSTARVLAQARTTP